MAHYRIPGPDKEWLDLPDVLGLLGNISDKTLRRLIEAGRFPRGIRAGHLSPPRWHASAVAAWQYLQPMLEGDDGDVEDDAAAQARGQRRTSEGGSRTNTDK